MFYRSLRDCLLDLERNRQLVRISREVDPYLEMAEIHRRVQEAGGPALWFERVKGSPFQAASNLYGTPERVEFLFRGAMRLMERIIRLKVEPAEVLKHPLGYLSLLPYLVKTFPRPALLGSPITAGKTHLSALPQIHSWPDDGGAFITLPQVLSMDPDKPSLLKSNVGMYRIQISGNDYIPDQEAGLHYQLHRGIGVHHAGYKEKGESFRVSVFVGGPPSYALSAIFPLPEGLSELLFMGLLGGHAFRYVRKEGFVLAADADFCLTGWVDPFALKPEGPFGDHLGYYSLKHPFPYLKVQQVWHRKDPIWHFTVVGRPPAEDSGFGHIIHRIVGPLAPQEFPGLVELHAVDAAGVHPLLLAMGRERYMPFREKQPEEILTIGNRILGSGQTSLAKYLIIAEAEPGLSTHDMKGFFTHVLERVRWERDLHFQTKTTIDTLDYSGSGWNAGSKVIWACCGLPIRKLLSSVSMDLRLPAGFGPVQAVHQGILGIGARTFVHYEHASQEMQELTRALQDQDLDGFPLIIVCDDPQFLAADFKNFLWVTFTRSNPSHDIYGVKEKIEFKHWGCRGPLVIDARTKPHHAPPLVPDPGVSQKVDSLFAKGGDLYGIL